MVSTTDTPTERAVGERFLAALAHRDWDELQSSFADEVRFRALIPPGLREGNDAAAAAGYFRRWFGDADELTLQRSQIELIEGRLSISYRFRAHEDQWYVVEQRGYADIQDGRIERMDLLCSGFRPEH